MLRIGILDFHKLKMSDFATEEEGLKVAMDYLDFQRKLVPDIVAKHPDIVMPNPKACMFWYVMCEGTLTSWKKTMINSMR